MYWVGALCAALAWDSYVALDGPGTDVASRAENACVEFDFVMGE